MKSLITAGLLAAALVLTACGGSTEAEPSVPADATVMGDDTEALGYRNYIDPDKAVCDLLLAYNPTKWWRQGEYLGQDLIDTCLAVLEIKVIGDCAVHSRADCSGADLSGADLRGLPLSGLNLRGANLTGANLSNTHMTSAKLDGADLQDAVFANAQMYGVSLQGAVIEGADFSGAELRDAIWVDGRRCSLSSPRGQCS